MSEEKCAKHMALELQGNNHDSIGNLEELHEKYRQADALNQIDGDLLVAWAGVLFRMERWQESVDIYRRALDIRPDGALWADLGIAFMHLGQLGQAEQCYREAVTCGGEVLPSVWNNFGNILKDQGNLSESITCYRQALALDPGFLEVHSNLLVTLHYGEMERQQIFHEHQVWWQRCSEKEAMMQHVPPAGGGNLEKRLRVGFVSADFRVHSVGYFLQSLMENLDRNHLEIICYANRQGEDHVTRRFQAAADGWREISQLGDTAVAEMVRRDGIDILVDLAGHSEGNRLRLFALRPAPIQVTWIGYPDTTGLQSMDYRLTDDVVDPPGMDDEFHSEQLIRLPGGFLCYDYPKEAPAVVLPPMMRLGVVTFGSFNNLAKINDTTLDLWAELLNNIPNARLLLKNRSLACTDLQDAFRRRFEARSIDPKRVTMLSIVPSIQDHLNLYGKVDIALDTLPYNGTTTTFEALWMGVPLVALRGDRHLSRVTASLLTHMGLEEWVAETPAAYLEMNRRLATDGKLLRRLRLKMRGRLRSSPLCNAAASAGHLERAFREMWARWLAGSQ
ncbi:MAG: tetratricopeptide repeat protein [Magnetococcales bacterium]|nr:tetratricopeptide repeat protein [Magnetococcales bacterium]